MKTNIFILSALCLIGMACKDKEPTDIYPKEIPFTEYSLPEGCAWDGLVSDSLYLINSLEELRISCWANVVVDVDLDKYSLIVLQPSYCNIDSKVEKLGLQQVSASTFLFTADITPSVTANATPLVISVLVPKIAETVSVELNVNVHNNTENPLLGNWQEISPCNDCSLLSFSNNDTIYQKFTYDNSIVKLTYHFISEDSIQIERLTESETNPYTRKTNNKIVFYGNDSMLIKNFYVSDAAVSPPNFIDIKLLRTK